MGWLARIFTGIGNLLSPWLGGSWRKENRADFAQVGEMWQTLSQRLENRTAYLEKRIEQVALAEAECKAKLAAALVRIELLEQRLN